MSQLPPHIVKNFIDGKFVEPINGKYMDNYNPASGKVYGKVPDSDKEDIDRAVKSSQRAFETWSKTSKQERSKILNKLADLIEGRMDELAEIESRDQGKPISLARTVDLPLTVGAIRYFAGLILHLEEQAKDIEGLAVNFTQRVPMGVLGLISPWNFPLYLLTWKIAPALAVGDTVVCKPSELASVSAFKLCSILNESGVPPGVCNMVFGYGATAGASLVQHPDVSGISFTGGTATAQHIIRGSAESIKKVYTELEERTLVLFLTMPILKNV